MTLKCIMCGKESECKKRHAICICGNMMYPAPPKIRKEKKLPNRETEE